MNLLIYYMITYMITGVFPRLSRLWGGPWLAD